MWLVEHLLSVLLLIMPPFVLVSVQSMRLIIEVLDRCGNGLLCFFELTLDLLKPFLERFLYRLVSIFGLEKRNLKLGRQAAKAELEKLDLASDGISLEQAVKEAARIIYVAHDDNKDKEFELEMSWISDVDGPTKGRHEGVPKALLEEAERLAKKALEGDDDDEDDKKDDDKMEE
ncbi:Proteasome subunit alpha type-3 like protein [Verticillium longisporum]|nr:Proteasome subunit alpha type-3 like protein [Verticillium longisporum]